MKTVSTLAKVMCVVLVCTGATFADSDPGSQTIQYNGSQSDYTLSLKNDITQITYENQDVPDTCSRDVPDGTESQCHVETNQVCGPDTIRHVCEDKTHQECTPVTKQECGPVNTQECTTVDKNECHDVTHQECTPVTKQECGPVSSQECSTVYKSECHEESHQECSPTSREECTSHEVCHEVGHSQQCSPEQECHTVTDQDCREVSQNVCENVPEQECHDVSHNECHNVTDQDCRDVSQNVCQNVPEQQCHDVSHNECHDVTNNVCHDVTQNECRDEHTPNCQDVSKNVCVDVPKTRHESYACTKTIQVPTGTELISSDTANVSLHFDPSAIKSGAAAEEYVCTLANGTVGFQLNSTPASDLLLFEQLTQNSVSSDSQHRQITAKVGIRGVNLADAELPLTQSVADGALTSSSLQFSLAKISAPDLLALQVQITADSDGSVLLAKKALDLSKAQLTATADGRTLIAVDLSQLGLVAAVIAPGTYQLQVTGALVVAQDAGLLNPAALANLPQLSQSVEITVDDSVTPAPTPTPTPTPAVAMDDIVQITSAGIQNLSLTTSDLTFNLGLLKEADFVRVHLKIQEDHVWGLWQTTQVDKDLTDDQLKIDNSSGSAAIAVDLAAVLGNALDDSSTYQVDLTVTPNADVLSQYLSSDQLGQLKAATAEQKFDL